VDAGKWEREAAADAAKRQAQEQQSAKQAAETAARNAALLKQDVQAISEYLLRDACYEESIIRRSDGTITPRYNYRSSAECDELKRVDARRSLGR